MAVSTYKENGREFYCVYVQAKGKEDKNLRLQRKRKKIVSFREAQKLEKALFTEVIEQIAKIEGRGLTWREIIDRWEIKARRGDLGDKYQNNYLIQTHVNRLNEYTKIWLQRRASDLTPSQEIRRKTWEQFERAKIFDELSQKMEYGFIKEEFKEGLKCKYGGTSKHLVKVFSQGKGIEIDINRDLVKDIPQGSAFVECLIRSLGDTFSKSYYQAKGVLMHEQHSLEDIVKAVKAHDR